MDQKIPVAFSLVPLPVISIESLFERVGKQTAIKISNQSFNWCVGQNYVFILILSNIYIIKGVISRLNV